jgi:hypothetical protein
MTDRSMMLAVVALILSDMDVWNSIDVETINRLIDMFRRRLNDVGQRRDVKRPTID